MYILGYCCTLNAFSGFKIVMQLTIQGCLPSRCEREAPGRLYPETQRPREDLQYVDDYFRHRIPGLIIVQLLRSVASTSSLAKVPSPTPPRISRSTLRAPLRDWALLLICTTCIALILVRYLPSMPDIHANKYRHTPRRVDSRSG